MAWSAGLSVLVALDRGSNRATTEDAEATKVMFDDPEYASYIALCRELRPEREFRLGDWWIWDFDGLKPSLCVNEERTFDGWEREPIWLPRLDQWLAMLEKAGWTVVKFSPAVELMDGSPALWRVEGWGWDRGWNTKLEFTELRTREEAAARLWMAVTGRKESPDRLGQQP